MWSVPTRSQAQSDAAWRRRRKIGPGTLTTSSANRRQRKLLLCGWSTKLDDGNTGRHIEHEQTRRLDSREWRATSERRDADSHSRDVPRSSRDWRRVYQLRQLHFYSASDVWSDSRLIVSLLPVSVLPFFIFLSPATYSVSHSIHLSLSSLSFRLARPLDSISLSPRLSRALSPSYQVTSRRISARNGASASTVNVTRNM